MLGKMNLIFLVHIESSKQETLRIPTGFEKHEELKRILSSFQALHPDQKRIDLIGINVFFGIYY